MRTLPAGTVTFLFTDVEGSTRLLHELGADAYAAALLGHRATIRRKCAEHGGVEVDTQGDAFFVAFPTATGALEAANQTTQALGSGPIHVRVGIHTGTPLLTDQGYVGVDVHRAARIAAAGHGGQVLVSATTAALVGIDGLRDLGEHRFKDLAAPERVYQLGSRNFPTLKSLHRTNLPVPATEFLGRERELAEVTTLIDEARLLTLTGPGGTGKTRLALQAAADVAEHFPDGVWWVPLAALRDPALVVRGATAAMGVEDPEALAGKHALLLFDNAEHLLPGLADELGPLLAIDGPTIVVTSRERLKLQGERVWPVPPLEGDDGRALFVERAQALDPSFAASNGGVHELCDRLEQLPLALELAAARTTLFTPRQLLERLEQRLDLFKSARDADPRQRTLRATIEWSHDLLSGKEQQLFRRLAVFVGGCTLESAEEVCDADLEVLQSLLDKSLVRRRSIEPEPRFSMLETIREFAEERLVASRELDDLSARHAEHFAVYCDRLMDAPSAMLTIRFEDEVPNIRAAFAFARTARDGELMVRFLTGASDLWLRAALEELREALAESIQLVPAGSRLWTRAAALLAFVLSAQGDHEESRAVAERAVTLARASGYDRELAGALNVVARLELATGNVEESSRILEESGELFRRAGDVRGQAINRANFADLMLVAGEYERAATLCHEALELFAAIGDFGASAWARLNLATASVHLGRLEDAAEHADSCIREFHRIGDRYELFLGLEVVAGVAAGLGDGQRAAMLLGAADVIRMEVGATPERSEQELLDLVERLLEPLLDPAARADALTAGRAMTADDAVALAIGDDR